MAFLKGAIWGVVIGGAGAAMVSVVAPQPPGALPPAMPDTAVAEMNALPETAAQGDITLPQIAPLGAPQATAPADLPNAPTIASDAPQADVGSSQPDAVDVAIAEPATPDATATGDMPGADAPVLPNPQSMPPQLPLSEADIVVDATPPTPVEVTTPLPDTAPTDSLVELTVVPDAEATTLPQTGADAPVAVVEDPAASAPATDDATVAVTDAPVAAATDNLPADAAPLVDTLADPADMPPLSADPVDLPTPPAGPADMPTLSDVTTEGPSDQAVAPEGPAQQPPVPPSRPAVVAIIDTPSSGLPGGDSGVVIRRPALTEAPPAVVDPVPELDDATPALVRYGAFFDNPESKPLMSILLIDDGTLPNGARALADVPFAVTVLLDPSKSGASERMTAYAAAGIEVAALATLPDGATASDAAVALEGTFDSVPEAIALVATDGYGLPATADVLGQVVTTLAADGRGLVVPDTGLNSALRAATAADVHATTLYRDLDSNGQEARVIRRFIDQAAFRARQQPGVVLLGRVRPETISALILWGQANRAGQVALAPLSATLLAQ